MSADKPKRSRGAPPKGEGNVRETELRVRMTETERADVEKRATERGLVMSDWVRQRLGSALANPGATQAEACRRHGIKPSAIAVLYAQLPKMEATETRRNALRAERVKTQDAIDEARAFAGVPIVGDEDRKRLEDLGSTWSRAILLASDGMPKHLIARRSAASLASVQNWVRRWLSGDRRSPGIGGKQHGGREYRGKVQKVGWQ